MIHNIKYAIMFRNRDIFLKLHEDGLPQETFDLFEAKTLPTRELAEQLARAILKNQPFVIYKIRIEALGPCSVS